MEGQGSAGSGEGGSLGSVAVGVTRMRHAPGDGVVVRVSGMWKGAGGGEVALGAWNGGRELGFGA